MAEAQRWIDAHQTQLVEIQSANDSLCTQIESTIALAKSQDQAIMKTQETIAKAQTYFERTLKAREKILKTLTDLSRQRNDLNKTFLPKQVELEVLKSDSMNNLTVSKKNCENRPLFKLTRSFN